MTRSKCLALVARWAISVLTLGAMLAGCGGGDDGAGSGPGHSSRVQSAAPLTVASVPQSAAKLVTHTMPAWSGGTTTATTLLFTPTGTPPSGGWPIVLWAHGTTSVLRSACAPSGSLDTLDGGLTAEGFTSRYAEVISYLVAAGYAVVAPDFEGLGPAAQVAYPYYNSASESRSLLAGLQAARLADPSLSSRWIAMGHSEGGRGVLALQSYVGEAAELDFRGTIALAPFTSLAEAVRRLDTLKSSDPANATLYAGIQNFFVAMLARGLKTVDPTADLGPLMGGDLAALMPTFAERCVFSSFGVIASAVAARPDFGGFKPGWSDSATMKAFLQSNDPAAVPGFKIAGPTLIVQGTSDIFVQEPLTTAFVNVQAGRGAPVAYRVYTGSDHGSIVIDAKDQVLSYLAARFSN